ncbi:MULTISPECIES: hypothetical protein [Halorussus]|uniref:hypothetical protein n=1 Tax=Halorussus TaxID=1070314 RepID=UPI0020A1D675|nr:hypothetical protein [Halorussus vallis]USZ78310.1 hypothetical protein NGM07_23545 [Halorussus vallis]USZ78335.1 hypothetical protein NGM07_22690 [Halorussus vallis]
MSTGHSSNGVATSLLLAIRKSFLAFVTTIGVVCCLLAALLSEYVFVGLFNGVLAGMFAVWGVSAFIYAVLGHLGLRLIGYH